MRLVRVRFSNTTVLLWPQAVQLARQFCVQASEALPIEGAEDVSKGSTDISPVKSQSNFCSQALKALPVERAEGLCSDTHLCQDGSHLGAKAAEGMSSDTPTCWDDLKRFQMETAKPRRLPLTTGLRLQKEGGPPTKERYSNPEAVGALMYLACCTRPDLCQPVSALARYTAEPKQEHQQAIKGLLRYLVGTTSYGIMYGSKEGLEAYCDSDHAGDVDSRRSTTGYVYMLHGGAISWSSKLQPTVAASTTEAE
jgi:hypothetical protein